MSTRSANPSWENPRSSRRRRTFAARIARPSRGLPLGARRSLERGARRGTIAAVSRLGRRQASSLLFVRRVLLRFAKSRDYLALSAGFAPWAEALVPLPACTRAKPPRFGGGSSGRGCQAR